MFHPVTSFVSLVECESAHTFTFISMSKSQFVIEVSTNYVCVSFAIFTVLLDRSVHLLDAVVRTCRVGEVYTHQFDALAVDQDRGGDCPFVDVFSISNSLPPLLARHSSNSLFVVVSSCTHENVFMMSPISLLCRSSTVQTIIKHPICSLRARKPILQFAHLSALISYSSVAR